MAARQKKPININECNFKHFFSLARSKNKWAAFDLIWEENENGNEEKNSKKKSKRLVKVSNKQCCTTLRHT